MAYRFDIKKQYWKRYQIIKKNFCQYQHFRMREIGKNEIGKYKTSKYEQLVPFRKSC